MEMVKIMSTCVTRGKVAKIILLVSVLFILILTISPQNALAEETRQVKNASEILDKVEKGELVAEENCTIIGDLDLSKINLSTIKVDGREQRRVNNSFSIKNSTIKGNVNFNDIYFSGPVNFYDGTNLTGGANFEKSIFSRSANFKNANFSCEADFSSAAFKGSTYFNGVHFADIANFDYATFNRLSYFNNVCFNDEARFDDAKFYDEVEFNNVFFKSVAAFRGSEFYNETQFNNATFNEDAQFDKARFKDKVEFKDYTKFNETASFRDATFSGLADFESVNFTKTAYFSNTEFKDEAHFSNATFNGTVKFNFAKFKDRSFFLNTSFKDDVDFTRTYIQLMNIEWSRLEGKLVYDDYFYQSLIRNFERLGLFDDANDAYYEYKVEHRKRINTKSPLGLIKRVSEYIFLDRSCGYGVKPLRPIGWVVFFIGLFAFLYWLIEEKDKWKRLREFVKDRGKGLWEFVFLGKWKGRKNKKLKSDSSLKDSLKRLWRFFKERALKFLFLSVSIFTTLGILNNWKSAEKHEPWFHFFAIIEVFLGWIIMVLFVISLTMTWIR